MPQPSTDKDDEMIVEEVIEIRLLLLLKFEFDHSFCCQIAVK